MSNETTDDNEAAGEQHEKFAAPIDELRSLLFETIRGVKGGQIPVENARAVEGLARVMVDSAKVEVQMVNATGGKYVQGFAASAGKPALPGPRKDH